MRTELSAALEQVIEAIVEASTSSLVIIGAEIDLPLEVTAAMRNSQLVFFGSAPHTRWITGVLPEVHLARLLVGIVDGEAQCGQ